MGRVPQETIEQYQRMLVKDPNSKVFAPLAEALRENGLLPQAERVAVDGVKRHPRYVGGYVALGRILIDQLRYKEAMPILKAATDLDPQNLLALHLLGNTYLQLQMPKEALKAFKMVLFLNPLSEKAKNAVQKLETVSAEDYEDDVFQYQVLGQPSTQKLVSTPLELKNILPEEPAAPTPASMTSMSAKELDRKLSLVDALIVRNDLERAREALMELNLRAPGNHEIAKRFDLLDEAAPEEDAAELSPVMTREKMIFDRKVALLEGLLRRVKRAREESLSEMS